MAPALTMSTRREQAEVSVMCSLMHVMISACSLLLHPLEHNVCTGACGASFFARWALVLTFCCCAGSSERRSGSGEGSQEAR